MNLQLDTDPPEAFFSELLKTYPNIELFLSLLLKTSSHVRRRDDFFTYVQAFWKSHMGIPIAPSFLLKIIQLLRLTGLLCRKYYQRSILSTFLLTYNIEIVSFLRIFHDDLSFMLERHLTHKIPLKDFQFLLISCSKWYIHLLSSNKDLTGRKIRPFQNVLCLAFDRFDENDLLIGAVRPVVQNYLKKQRLQQSRRGVRYQAKFISVDQLKKEPFTLPQFQHKERGLVLVNVLTDIYDWMTEYISPNRINQSKSYDPPYFDILAHAKKAKVIFKEKKSEKDRFKPVLFLNILEQSPGF